MTRAYEISYGAFELKRRYQRNMLWGTFSTAMVAAAIIGTIWIYGAYFTQPLIDIDDGGGWIRDTTTIIFIREPLVGPADPPRPSGPPKPPIPEDVKGGIITPVDNDTPEEETEPSIWDGYPDGPFDPDPDGVFHREGNYPGGGPIPGPGTDIPPIDTFIPHEVEPEFVHEEIPAYPRIAREGGFTGTVYLQVYIGIDGHVLEAVVVRCNRPGMGFEEAALEAAKKCLYRPAIQNGYPIGLWAGYTVKFILDDQYR